MMQLQRLEHVNIRTCHLELMAQWYQEMLGLTAGYRPPFESVGYWLYLGEQPIIHLVESTAAPLNQDPGMDHLALSATGLALFLERLQAADIPYHTFKIPELGDLQVNFQDPDHNKIHVDFPRTEAEALGF